MNNTKKWLIVLLIILVIASVLGYRGRHKVKRWLAEKHFITHKHPESPLAHLMLDSLKGVEIGGAAHNPFGLNTLNIDSTDDLDSEFKQLEILTCGDCDTVDIVAPGDRLPLPDNAVDFVISSHQIQRYYDPIKTVQEWLRVVKPGGYVYMIIPHIERTSTPLAELVDRHEHPNPPLPAHRGPYSFWIPKDFLELAEHQGWKVVASQEVDDKVGDGFTIVLEK